MPDAAHPQQETERQAQNTKRETQLALIVFAKIPKPARVKTRLTPAISPEAAAALYEAFLVDALNMYRQLPVDVRLYYSSPLEDVPPHLAPEDVSLHQQKGTGLGERMATAFAETFVAGYDRVVIIGTDHPTLPAAFIDLAFSLLEEAPGITIGPSHDGGYYLLGMNDFYPQLFQDMTYSHADVFAQTLARACDLEATLYVLPLWYDVDTPESLRRLATDLKESQEPLVRTRETMDRIAREFSEL